MPNQNVKITGFDTGAPTGSEPGTPVGYDILVPVNGSIKGTDGEDKATLATVLADKNQIFDLGDGNDVFVFRNNAEGSNGTINGIVNGGAGVDHVYLAGQVSDYVFSIRGTEGIKIHYKPGGDDGAAVTFNGWETFTFRGVDTAGVNHADRTLTTAELIYAIQNPTAPFPDSPLT